MTIINKQKKLSKLNFSIAKFRKAHKQFLKADRQGNLDYYIAIVFNYEKQSYTCELLEETQFNVEVPVFSDEHYGYVVLKVLSDYLETCRVTGVEVDDDVVKEYVIMSIDDLTNYIFNFPLQLVMMLHTIYPEPLNMFEFRVSKASDVLRVTFKETETESNEVYARKTTTIVAIPDLSDINGIRHHSYIYTKKDKMELFIPNTMIQDLYFNNYLGYVAMIQRQTSFGYVEPYLYKSKNEVETFVNYPKEYNIRSISNGSPLYDVLKKAVSPDID